MLGNPEGADYYNNLGIPNRRQQQAVWDAGNAVNALGSALQAVQTPRKTAAAPGTAAGVAVQAAALNKAEREYTAKRSDAQSRLDSMKKYQSELQSRAAGYAQEPGGWEKQRQAGQDARLLHSRIQSAQKDFDREYGDVDKNWSRWLALAGKQQLTESERREAQQAAQYLKDAAGSWKDATRWGGDKRKKAADIQALASILENKTNKGSAAAAGFVNALPGMGRLTNAAGRVASRQASTVVGDEQLKGILQGNAPFYDAYNADEKARNAGQVAGGLFSLYGMSNAANGALGKIPGFAQLPRMAQQAAGSAATFGGDALLRTATEIPTKAEWDAVERQKAQAARAAGESYEPKPYSLGGQLGNVALQGGIAAVGGAAGSLLSYGVGQAGAKFLTRYGLMQPWAEAVRNTAQGTAFAAGNVGVSYLLEPEEQKPTQEEMGRQLATAFIFSALTAGVETYRTTQASKAHLDDLMNQMKEAYLYTTSRATTPEQKTVALNNLERMTNYIRNEINQQYYPGQQNQIQKIMDGLDAMDEWVLMERGIKMPGLLSAGQGGMAPAGQQAPPPAPAGASSQGLQQAAMAQYNKAGRAGLTFEQAQQANRDLGDAISKPEAYQAWAQGQNTATALQNEPKAGTMEAADKEQEAPSVAPSESREVQQAPPAIEAALPGAMAEEGQAEKYTAPHEQIADGIQSLLEEGKPVYPAQLYQIADRVYGGTQAEGAYSIKDAYDAVELAVNRYLLQSAKGYNGDAERAQKAVGELQELVSRLPTQSKRTDEMVRFQQFSTPPHIAYLAAWSAGITPADTVLEPSAGVGGLAVFPKAWGATVYGNELSPRRLEVLKSLGLDGVFNENAEQIDNVLPGDIRPTVVLMNPPFSSAANRTTKTNTANAARHIEQALERLEEGGRLVAILGRGMADDTPAFKKWWADLKQKYNVRANIRIDGKNYRKYGTTFDVQLVVIDKNGATRQTVTGAYTDLAQIPSVLEEIRNDRDREAQRDGNLESGTAAVARQPEQRQAVSGAVAGDAGGNGAVGPRGDHVEPHDLGGSGRSRGAGLSNVAKPGDLPISGRGGRGNRRSGLPTGRTAEADGAADGNNNGRGVYPELPVSAGGPAGQPDAADGVRAGAEPAPAIKVEKAPRKKAKASDDGVFAPYTPQKVAVKGAKAHPAPLVESAAMSAVEPPDPTYKPDLPENVIRDGLLSLAQLENVIYAGQSHEQMLPDGKRRGYFIGDGTGVGKGRQIAGIILDNFRNGRTKAVWVSKNDRLVDDAIRDWVDLGGSKEQIQYQGKAAKIDGKITMKEGILFSSYPTLQSAKGSASRLQQIVDWVGKDFDGVIVFDEAHLMGNALDMKGKRGTRKASARALAGVALQNALPNARIVYASATGATEVGNLSYATRLGLWGKGTPFNDVRDFTEKISAGGLAAMELVARDMKAMGVYMARSISYEGVQYGTVSHKLTPMQREIYNTTSKAWQMVLQNVNEALELTGGMKDGKARSRALGGLYNAMQRFYNQVLTSMSMPSVIKDMQKELAAGHSCVLQLVNTNEAAANKAIEQVQAAGTSLDEMDMTPSEILIGYVRNSFPVMQYEEYEDENGNMRARQVLDGTGNPVESRAAVRLRESIITQLQEMKVPDGPLEMLLDAFGTEQVAEVTGRSRRVVQVRDDNGTLKRVIQPLTKNSVAADARAFQEGKKRILVFSDAGGTGKSYHADLRAKNRQLRIHYLLQPGWNASTAVQGFGRTHRSNQAQPPAFKLVTTDIMGQKRFISTIARRLDQLGALTKGQRQASGGMFGERDNLENPLAFDVLANFYKDLGANRVPGIEDGLAVLDKMGLKTKFTDEKGRFNPDAPVAREMNTFLNRILALEVDEQNSLFNTFYSRYEEALDQAVKDGTLDMGMENVKADKIQVVDEKVIRTDGTTGAETKYVQLKTYTKPNLVPYDRLEGLYTGFKGLYRLENGEVRAVYQMANKTTAEGAVVAQYRLQTPDRARSSVYAEKTLTEKARPVAKKEWAEAWREQSAKVPAFNEKTLHLLTGTLLPVWNRLPQENTRVMRVQTEDGKQYLGRLIRPNQIDGVLQTFGAGRTREQYTPADVAKRVLQGETATLEQDRIKLQRRRVSGEYRIEITGNNLWYLAKNLPGVLTETINFERRYFVPVGGKAEGVLAQLLKDNPVVDLSAADDVDKLKGANGNGQGEGDPSSTERIKRICTEKARLFTSPTGHGSGRGDRRLDLRGFAEVSRGRRTKAEIYRGKSTYLTWKPATDAEKNQNARKAEAILQRIGVDVHAYSGSIGIYREGVYSESDEAFTFRKKANGRLNIAVYLSAEMSINGTNTGYHEGIHCGRALLPRGYDALTETLCGMIDTESAGFDNLLKEISELYGYNTEDVANEEFAKAFGEEVFEEIIAHMAGEIMAADEASSYYQYMQQFIDVPAARRVIEDFFDAMERRAGGDVDKRDGTPGDASKWQADRVSDGDKTEAEGLSNIIGRIRHDYGIPVNSGHIRGKGVLGEYRKKAETIRSRVANDLPTISHELGHHLDNLYQLTDHLPRELAAELEQGMDEALRAKYPKGKLVTEGFAEFVRRYLQNHETAAIDYPAVTAHFMEALPRAERKRLNEFADEINAYYALGAESAASSIALRGDRKDLRDGKERAGDKFDALYQAWVDSNHGIKRFADYAGDQEPYILATNSAYADSIAYSVVTGDLTDSNGQPVGDGLAKALKGIHTKDKKEYRAFGEYLVVRHGPERLKRGMRVFADDRKNSSAWMENRRAQLEEQYPAFAGGAERLYQFQESLLQTWGVDTGLIAPELAEKWKKQWADYVPLNRAVERNTGGGVKRGFANQTSPIKRAKGSGLDIVHPVENIIQNAVKMVHAATLNHVMQEIADLAEDTQGAGMFLEKVPAPMQAKQVKTKQLKEKLQEAFVQEFGGANEEALDAAFEILQNNIDDVLVQFGKKNPYGSIVTVLRRGKAEYWKVNDPLLLDSITNLTPNNASALLKAYGRVTRLITSNITGNNLIWSVFSNLPRDLMTFFTFSKDKNIVKLLGNIGASYVNTLAEMRGKGSPLFKEYRAMGGGHVSALTGDQDRTAKVAENIHGKHRKVYNPLDWGGAIMDTIETVGDMIESGPRFAYYKILRQQGMTPQQAFYASQDITVNFRRGGRLSRELNKAVPFFNANVQGLDRFARWAAAEDVPQEGRTKARAARWAMFLTASAALAALMFAVNGQDEEHREDYKQLSAYTKNSYWNIPLGDGKFFAIPKPREIAVLSSAMERAMELYGMDNPDAFRGFWDYAANNLLPPVVSDLAQGDVYAALGSLGIVGTISYMGANRDFRGNPIVSQGMDLLEPKAQYDGRTTKIAKALGEALNASPKKIDYFFNNVFGGFYKITAALFPVGEEYVDKSLGVKNTYIKDNRYSTDVLNAFYDKKDGIDRKHKTHPEDMEVAIQAKDYQTMASFYSNYNRLAKDRPRTNQRERTRQLVLDMFKQFEKEQAMGKTTEIKGRLDDFAREIGNTELYPQVMDVILKTGEKEKRKEYTLTDNQYVEFQTIYLTLYWEKVEQAFRRNAYKSNEALAKAIQAAKNDAKEEAVEKMLKRVWAK